MRTAKEIAGRKCPVCGRTENQVNAGKNRSGTQRCFCKDCKKYYTHEPKTRAYPEEIRNQAIKTYYVGASGRGVGKVFGFSKRNATVQTVTLDILILFIRGDIFVMLVIKATLLRLRA